MKPIAFEHANRTLYGSHPEGIIEPPAKGTDVSEEEIARLKARIEKAYSGPGRYPDNVTSVDPLPVWSDGRQCVSCWKMSWRERLSALLFGRVWLNVLGGQTQSPVYVQASRTYLKVSGPKSRCHLRGLSPLEMWDVVVAGCNCLLVWVGDMLPSKTESGCWGKATDFPPEVE